MRILFDTNVIVDLLLKRVPWEHEAAEILRLSGQAGLSFHVTATTLTDVHYICRKKLDAMQTIASLRFCVDNFEICTVGRREIEAALALNTPDFEDNLQIACAIANRFDAVVTRDAKFPASQIPIMSATTLLQKLTQKDAPPDAGKP